MTAFTILKRRAGEVILPLAVVTIVLYICTFKLIDNDFWWHVKAGELMWNAKALIRTEPFSYVLADKPYGALHEWLAQILFYLIFASGGVTASILLRGILTAAAALCLLAIDRKSLLVAAPLTAIGFYLQRPSLMVRPQLFTIFLLCLSLLLVFRFARSSEEDTVSVRKQRLFFVSVVIIQLLWVNLHGASAIFGVLLTSGLLLQGWLAWYVATGTRRSTLLPHLRFRGLLFAVTVLLLLASPNLFNTFIDMYAHRFDRTIPLVREWMPLQGKDYITDVLPFAIIAWTLVILRRRSWLLCATLLIVMGLLSAQAYRHCILFVMTCLAVTFFQLADFKPWLKLRERLLRFPLATLAAALLLLALLWGLMLRNDLTSVVLTNTFGLGVDIAVEDAAEFVAREKITGTLFNSYNQGGYLLYRLTPEHKVFADGRNIEYGYPFLQKLLDAGTNPVRWRELDEQYRFTYAIVEYKATPGYDDTLPYITFLEADPTWNLVYLDDRASVYVRTLPQYEELIRKSAYKVLSPYALEFVDTLEELQDAQWGMAAAELRRVLAENPRSIKPRLLLAERLLATNKLDEAEAMAKEALALEPYRPELFELLGRISVERLDWSVAGAYLERAAALTDADAGPGINYDYLAMIFSKAGEYDKAKYYHHKAMRAGQHSIVVPKESQVPEE